MSADEAMPDPLAAFHPAIAEWFRRRFPEGPTEAQVRGWEAIAGGHDTLIAAPTGSGKTLAGFLVAIDRCFRTPPAGPAPQGAGEPGAGAGPDAERAGTQVIYVSPLRALTVDIAENLERPLEEMRQIGEELGVELPPVRVSVRNGDTPPSARAAMLRHPPEIVVTTPESLYLLVTSPRGRALLANVSTVIVDEIHALARDKRGSHLSLSLERVDHCVEGPKPVRIGLSATQRPIEAVARLLVGCDDAADRSGEREPRCRIVDTGHRRRLDLSIELPGSELGAVATSEQLAEILDMIATEVATRRTTLVFVNTRRMAERIAHLLGERLGPDAVCAHHGSLSTERRLRVESRLRAGDLRALVATASLELGIDVGPVDLVCQLGSPRAIATFLQRVGRSQHRLHGTPTGRLYPSRATSWSKAPPCSPPSPPASSTSSNRRSPRSTSSPSRSSPSAPAPARSGRRTTSSSWCGAPPPTPASSAADFDDVVELVHQGVTTGRGGRGAHLHRDRVNGVLRARRGARITALTSGGAIPEVADYRVVLEPEDTLVGTVNEDWAIESMAGDVFLLGTNSWRIRRVEPAGPSAPSTPPAHPRPCRSGSAKRRPGPTSSRRRCHPSAAASTSVSASPARTVGRRGSRLPAASSRRLQASAPGSPTRWWRTWQRRRLRSGRSPPSTSSCSSASSTTPAALSSSCTPPSGRGSTGRSASPSASVSAAASTSSYRRPPATTRCCCRWRPTTASRSRRSLPTSRRRASRPPSPRPSWPRRSSPPAGAGTSPVRSWRSARGGRRVPPPIQRMEADDLMVAVFPALAGCQENATGPIEIPDHPLVRQTMHDCLTEAMDLERVTSVLEGVRAGTITTRFVETAEPSPLSHEIINGRPYTFLDDAPLEERRSRAVQLRRGIPLEEHSFSALDPEVLAQVCRDAAPEPRDAEELHDLLCTLVVMEPDHRFEDAFESLVARRRAMTVSLGEEGSAAAGAVGAAGAGSLLRWCALDRRPEVEALWRHAAFTPDVEVPAGLRIAVAAGPGRDGDGRRPRPPRRLAAGDRRRPVTGDRADGAGGAERPRPPGARGVGDAHTVRR